MTNEDQRHNRHLEFVKYALSQAYAIRYDLYLCAPVQISDELHGG